MIGERRNALETMCLVVLIALGMWVVEMTAATAETRNSNSGAAAATVRTTAQELSVSVDGGRTEILLKFQGRPAPVVFVAADPPRVIIDLADVDVRLPAQSVAERAGLVTGLRYGLLAPGRSRVVIDTTGPAAIDRAELQEHAGGTFALSLVLTPTDAATFRAAAASGPTVTAAAPGQRQVGGTSEPPSTAAAGTARSAGDRRRPLIVVDPGHGGLDPGAVGRNGVLEKDIVLAVARQLHEILSNRRRYDIVLTRGNDVFVPLDQRVAISENAGADLFISIHADSLEQTDVASTVRGATVYTLSDRASDEQARRLADKENAVDLLAGLGAGSGEISDPVRDILVDLLRRETTNFSSDFRKLLVGKLGRSIALSRDPTRSAAFRVLRQPQTPAVLIELGYMSNAEDQALMAAPSWQRKVAASIAEAVDAYFDRRTSATVRTR